MARTDLSVTVDTTEVSTLVDEFCARVKEIGPNEAQHRIGCDCDEAFCRSLIEFVRTPTGIRLVPTEEFNRVLLLLW